MTVQLADTLGNAYFAAGKTIYSTNGKTVTSVDTLSLSQNLSTISNIALFGSSGESYITGGATLYSTDGSAVTSLGPTQNNVPISILTLFGIPNINAFVAAGPVLYSSIGGQPISVMGTTSTDPGSASPSSSPSAVTSPGETSANQTVVFANLPQYFSLGTCSAVNLQVQDASTSAPEFASQSISASFSLSNVSAYSDAACANLIQNYTFGIGQQTAAIYVQATGLGVATLNLNIKDSVSAYSTLTLNTLAVVSVVPGSSVVGTSLTAGTISVTSGQEIVVNNGFTNTSSSLLSGPAFMTMYGGASGAIEFMQLPASQAATYQYNVTLISIANLLPLTVPDNFNITVSEPRGLMNIIGSTTSTTLSTSQVTNNIACMSPNCTSSNGSQVSGCSASQAVTYNVSQVQNASKMDFYNVGGSTNSEVYLGSYTGPPTQSQVSTQVSAGPCVSKISASPSPTPSTSTTPVLPTSGSCNQYGCSSCGTCSAYGCPTCVTGETGATCNQYGCSSCGTCTTYGCPDCQTGSGNGTCNQYGCSSCGACSAYGCPTCVGGETGATCNQYGCSSCGTCTAYGCPNCEPGASGNGTCNEYGCSSCGTCTAYGCPNCQTGQTGGTCTAYGCSSCGTCTAYGCPSC